MSGPSRARSLLAAALALGLLTADRSVAPRVAAAGTDLDAFMQQVLVRRDDNWRKLQQYILDEREQILLDGPGRQRIWGELREYTWYIRDGFFVRSPVTLNGAPVGEGERRKYEDEFLRRAQRREQQRPGDPQAAPPPGEAGSDEALASNVDGLIRQTRQPGFISSAYFLRFKFEEGKYALVGREQLDGLDVLRVEYYPERLYTRMQGRRAAGSHDPKDPRDLEIQRMLNKVALVTLWIEPDAHQIVKYAFDNIDFDFLPAQWLARVNEVRATMSMGRPFTDVWLPRQIDVKAAVTLAVGRYDFQYAVDFHDYRQPDVKTKVHIPGDR